MNDKQAKQLMQAAANFAFFAPLLVIMGAVRLVSNNAAGELKFIYGVLLLAGCIPLILYHFFKTCLPLFRLRDASRFKPAIEFGSAITFFVSLAWSIDGLIWIFLWIAVLQLLDPLKSSGSVDLEKHFLTKDLNK